MGLEWAKCGAQAAAPPPPPAPPVAPPPAAPAPPPPPVPTYRERHRQLKKSSPYKAAEFLLSHPHELDQPMLAEKGK